MSQSKNKKVAVLVTAVDIKKAWDKAFKDSEGWVNHGDKLLILLDELKLLNGEPYEKRKL